MAVYGGRVYTTATIKHYECLWTDGPPTKLTAAYCETSSTDSSSDHCYVSSFTTFSNLYDNLIQGHSKYDTPVMPKRYIMHAMGNNHPTLGDFSTLNLGLKLVYEVGDTLR